MEEKDPGPDGEESRAESDPDDPQIGSQKPSLRREPSFSRWCGEHRIACSLEASSDGGAAAEERENFELPLLHGFGGGLENGNMEPELQRSGDFHQRSKVHVPFDIENGGIHTSESVAKLEALEESARSLVKASTVIKTLFFIFIWYTFSTCLTLYNKTLLGVKYGNFPAPLLMNTVHFTLQAILSRIIACVQSRWSETGPVMSWRDYFMIVVPTALGTALDINLSNASLVSISVTFATMCKSAAPIFLLLFAFAFRLESPSFKLLGIILIISSGVLLTVSKETEFEFWGFVFVMLAAVMSGFRWCMTQILLQKESYGLKNPITLMSSVTPVMAAATAILSLFLDPWHNFKLSEYFDNSWHMVRSSLLMLLGGALAFFMVLAEYILISATSAVTVTIAGVVKEAVTIMVAVFYFHDQFTWLKGVGLLLILFGVSLFNWYKYQKLKKGHLSKTEEKSPAMSYAAAKYVILDELDPEYGE